MRPRIRFLSRRKRMMEDLAQDIRDFIERGMSPEEVLCAARRKFGNVS